MVAAVLLASRDLWNMQARAVGGLLSNAGVAHRVVESEAGLARTPVGRFTRSGEQRRANAPAIVIPSPRPGAAPPGAIAATLVVLAGVLAGLALLRDVPSVLKGAILAAGLTALLALAYSAWISPVAPLDVRTVLVDWRTSALVPIVGVALLFAYDLYPLPGSFVVKTVWLGAALAATGLFSTLRLAFVVASYGQFGPPAFLPVFLVAGTFWDLAAGIGVLALAHAGLSIATSSSPAALLRRRTR